MNAPLPPPVSRRFFHALWITPVVFLIAVTVLFRVFPWDLEITKAFYDAAREGFFMGKANWVLTLYHKAPIPGIALASAALIGLIASRFYAPLKAQRRLCWVVFLSLALGPGLVVNAILKDHWGRPRPVQTDVFGGSEPFLSVGTLGDFPQGRSFSSGHASIGFYLIAPFFALIAYRPRLAWTFLIIGLLWGFVVGAGRVLQGGHWPSDVLWSAGLVSLASFVLSRAFGLLRPRIAHPNRQT